MKKYQKRFSYLLSLFIILFIQLSHQTFTLSGVAVSSSPSTVGYKQATFRLNADILEPIAKNSVIVITAPSTNGELQFGGKSPLCKIDYNTNVNNYMPCTVSSLSSTQQLKVLTITVNITSLQASSMVIWYMLNFINPNSTAAQNSFTMNIYTSASQIPANLQASQTDGIALIPAAGTLSSTSIVATGTQSVGQATTVQIQFTNANFIPSGGQLQILLPQWNVDGSLTQSYVSGTSLICTESTGKASAICSFSPTTNTITITNAYTSNTNANTVSKFTISQILNPISMEPVKTLIVQTLTSTGGVIDSGTLSFTAGAPAVISTNQLTINSTIYAVQEYSILTLTFQNPVPLSVGCKINVNFPSEFQLNNNLVQVFGYGQIFQTYHSVQFSMNSVDNTVSIPNQCVQYTDSSKVAGIQFIMVKNPDYVVKSSSFYIELVNNNGYLIATLTNGLSFQTMSGGISNFAMSPGSKMINSVTSMNVQFTPSHDLTNSGMIYITLPANIKGSCSISSKSNQFSSGFTCTQFNSTTYQFSNLFSATGYQGNSTLFIQFAQVTLPNSVQDLNAAIVSTYETDSNQQFMVDYNFTNGILVLTGGTFLKAAVTPDTSTIGTKSTFEFSFTTQNAIPANGILTLQYPAQVALSSSFSCKNILQLTASITCTNAGSIITIKNAIPQTGIAANTAFSFSISQFTTPYTTQTSSSFQLKSLDASSNLIDSTTGYLTVTMTKGIGISTLTAASDSYVVGASNAAHTLKFTSTVILANQNQMIITIPNEITPPASGMTCLSSAPLQSQLYCTISGRIVTVQLMLSTASSVTLNQQISIKLQYLTNPVSTKPTSSYQLKIIDQQGYIMATTSSTSAVLIMTTPATMTQSYFSAVDPYQTAVTSISASVINIHAIPSGGKLKVKIDPTQINPHNDYSCTSNLQMSPICQYSETTKTFTISNLFTQNYPSGSNITMTFNNMEIVTKSKITTTSWAVTTYTDDGYAIDQITTGLSLKFNCNSPCVTCPDSNPNQCLSCGLNSQSPILYAGSCIDTCPSQTYYSSMTQSCQKCDPICQTCNYYDGSACTSCIASSKNPYLSGYTCSDKCAFGYYGNTNSFTCSQCQSPCASCSSDATTCTSCDSTSQYKYLYGNKCLSSCPAGFYAAQNLGDSSFSCKPCDSNCKECVGSANYCTKCNLPNILSLLDNVCVQSCPLSLTIYDSSKNTCNVCNQTCETCQNSVNFCTSCQKNLNLLRNTGQCVNECATNKTLVGVNGVCVGCNSKCLTCQSTPDQCLTCQPNFYFYNYTCVDKCKTGYAANSQRKCVLDGLVCPFGYEPNALGDACILNAQVCEPGFRLNLDKTRCIPVPGKYIPFPLILTCFFLSLICVASKFKYRPSLLTSNVVALISLIEVVGILAQVILSYIIGLRSTFALSLISLLFLFGSNIFFLVVYLKQVKADAFFKHFAQNYSITSRVISIVSLFNFKFYRIIYGKLFGLDHFNAPFQDHNNFYKPYTFISVFSIITSMLPLLVGNIIGLVFIDYGYQVFINCLEMTIIELVILGISIYEYIMLKRQLIGTHQYYKVEPKTLGRGANVNVMSGLLDEDSKPNLSLISQHTLGGVADSSYQQKEPQDKQTYGEFFERRRTLEKLLNKLKGKVSRDGNLDNSTEALINELQEEEIMRLQMRNCRSFRDLRELDEDFADQNAADIELQNFISCPNSPREKDMLYNPFFQGSINELKKIYRQRDQGNNVYAEAKPLHQYPLRDCKLVSVKVQVNPLDLLGINDSMISLARKKKQEDEDREEEGYVEENFGDDYTRGILNNVIGNVHDMDFKKKRRRLPKKRLQEIPNFELHDIMGDFEIDDHGNNIIVKGKDGKLNDKEGKRVNRRGYCVDVEGNIVLKKNHRKIIFRKDEIDSDDEIPAPFCFEKKKESFFKVENGTAFNKKQNKASLEDQSEDIENEYNKLKQQNKSNRSSVNSLMGETPSKYNKKNKKKFESDDDAFINKIVQPLQAKTKDELVKGNKTAKAKHQEDNDSQRTMESKNNQSQKLGFKGTASFNNTNKFNNSSLDKKQTTHASKNSNKNNYQQLAETSILDESQLNGTQLQDQSIVEENSQHYQRRQQESVKDLFFNLSQAKGTQRNRPHPANIPTQSTIQSRAQAQNLGLQNQTSNENPLFYTSDEAPFNKFAKLKEALGMSKEDEVLRRRLQKLESNFSLQSNQKASLATKNLARVYGKVQEKYGFENNGFQDRKTQESLKDLFSGFEDNESNRLQSMQRKRQHQISKLGMNPMLSDTRMKGLEQIYLQKADQRTQSALSKNRLQEGAARFRPLQHNLMEFGGFDTSDQEEQRLKNDISNMKQILEKESNNQQYHRYNPTQVFAKAKTKTTGSAAVSNKHLMQGGWL